MARKLNRNLVGLLTLVGMILLAVTGFTLLANLPGQDPTIYEADAKQFEEDGKFDLATQTYYRAYTKDPLKNPEYLVKAAKCALADGKLPPARDLIRNALVRNPQLKSALELSTELEFEIAKIFPSPFQWNKVLQEAKRLIEIDAQSVLAHTASGMAYIATQSEDPNNRDEGKKELEKAVELDPTAIDAVEGLANQLWVRAREKDAASHQEEAEALDNARIALLKSTEQKAVDASPEALSKVRRFQAIFKILEGDSKEGLAELEKQANSGVSDVDAHLLLGRLYLGAMSGKVSIDLAKGKAVLEKGLEIDPKNGDLYTTLGQAFKMERQAETDNAKKTALTEEEMAVYRKGLDAIPLTRHFREFKNNRARISFFRELFLWELEKADTAKDPAAKDDALAAAAGWVEKLKKEADPEAPEVRFMVASLLNAQGKFVEATQEAEAAERSAGTRGHLGVEVLLGELYVRQQQWGAARKCLERAIELGGESPPLLLRLAEVYLRQDMPSQALVLLKQDVVGARGDYMRNNPIAARLRMEAYRQLGQIRQAIQEGEKSGDTAQPQGELRVAMLLIEGKQYDEAEAKLKAILDKEGDNPQAARLLVRLYRNTNRQDVARALAKSLGDKYPQSRMYRAMQIELDEGLDEGMQEQKLVEILSEEKDPFMRAVQLFDFFAGKEKLTEARKYLDEAEKLKPEEPIIVDRQFRLALRDQDWERAEHYAKKSAELNSDGTSGAIFEGRLLATKAASAEDPSAATKLYNRAVEVMKTGLQRYPNYSMGWTFLAEVYMSSGRRADAKNALQEALKRDPTNGLANRNMAELANKEGDVKEAEKYLRLAEKTLPDDSYVKQQLQILQEKENPLEGIASREKIRKEKPDDLNNLILLARLYALPEVGEFDKAADVYREAYKVAKEDFGVAMEFASMLGRPDVNRPSEGDALLAELLKKQTDKSKKALLATYLGRFHEQQKTLATADRHYRLAVSLDPSVEILTTAGEYYSRTNRFNDALEYYERALKQAASDSLDAQSIHSRIIALCLALGSLEKARTNIDAFLQKYPNDADGMIFEGAYHRIAGDIQQARKSFDTFLEKNPDNSVALWQRGQLFMLMGRWQQAIEDLRKSKTFNPDGFSYQHRISLADAYFETANVEAAINELKQILDEHPDEQDVARALVDIYARAGGPRLSEAENIIYTYLRKYPRDYRWPMLLGAIAERSRNFDKAIDAYQKAAEVGNYRPDAIQSLFRACKDGNRPQVIIDYGAQKLSARVLGNMPRACANIAWAYTKTGQSDKALEAYDQALGAAGTDFTTYTGVVAEIVDAYGIDKALEQEQKRAEADPANVDRQKVLIHLYHIANRPDDAMALCDKILKSAVRDNDILFAHLARALLLQQANRLDEAKTEYETVLKTNPDNSLALNNLAYMIGEQLNRPAEALPYAERAKRRAPNDLNVLDTYGWMLALNNRLGEALGALLRALELNRENPDVLYHVAVVYQRRGEFEDAQQRLEAAKSILEKRLERAKSAAEKQATEGLLSKINKGLEEVKQALSR